MIIDPQQQTQRENYKLLIGSIVPRPIAFVSTISREGIPNLAPFSFFTGLTSAPPTLGFAPGRKGPDGSRKDTLLNIEATGEFVVNVVNLDLAEPMNDTATDFPPEVNEFEAVGLTAVAGERVQVPRVLESPISMECRLQQIVEIGPPQPGAGFFVIGEILLFHVADALLQEGRVDMEKLDPLGRLAGMEYTTLGRRFTLTRKKISGE